MSVIRDSGGRLRTFWRFAIFGAGMVVVQIAVSLIAFVGLVYYLLVTEELTEFGNPTQLAQLMESHLLPLIVIGALPTGLLPFAWMAVCRRYLDRRTLASSGFIRPPAGVPAALGVGMGVGLLPILLIGGFLAWFGGLELHGWGGTVMPLLLTLTFLLMAFHEEVVFRGYLYQNLIDVRRPRFGLIFSATLFWLVHSLNPDAWSSPLISINLFGAGIVLGLAYRAAGNIWFPTAMHFGWNFAQGLLFGVPVSGIDMQGNGFLNWSINPFAHEWLTGGKFGFEGSALLTVMEVLLVAGFLVYLRKHPVGSQDENQALSSNVSPSADAAIETREAMDAGESEARPNDPETSWQHEQS